MHRMARQLAVAPLLKSQQIRFVAAAISTAHARCLSA